MKVTVKTFAEPFVTEPVETFVSEGLVVDVAAALKAFLDGNGDNFFEMAFDTSTLEKYAFQAEWERLYDR